ncbi:UNVERIFIED_CONTAM: protein kinase [Hammondia hammondi]|eukprot:XP_008885726.1 protein kinase [Hammondia hammondi]
MWEGHYREVGGAANGDPAWQPYSAVQHDGPVLSPSGTNRQVLSHAPQPTYTGEESLSEQMKPPQPAIGQWPALSSSDIGMQSFSTGMCVTASPGLGLHGVAPPRPASPALDDRLLSFPAVGPNASSRLRGSRQNNYLAHRGRTARRIAFPASPSSQQQELMQGPMTIGCRHTVLRPRTHRDGLSPRTSRGSWSPLRFCSGNTLTDRLNDGAMCVAYVSPVNNQSVVGVGRDIGRSSASQRDRGKVPTRRSDGKTAGWLLPKSPRIQSPSSRRYELAAVAALVTPRVVPVPRLTPSPTNRVFSEEAPRLVDSSCCFPPSPVSRGDPPAFSEDNSYENSVSEPGRSGATHNHAFPWKDHSGEAHYPHSAGPAYMHQGATVAGSKGGCTVGTVAAQSGVSTFDRCEMRPTKNSASSAVPTSPTSGMQGTGEYGYACNLAIGAQGAEHGVGPMPASLNNRLPEIIGKNHEKHSSVAVSLSACSNAAVEQANTDYATTRWLVGEGKLTLPHTLGDQTSSVRGGPSGATRTDTSEYVVDGWSKSEAMANTFPVCISDPRKATEDRPRDSPGDPAVVTAEQTLAAAFSQWHPTLPAAPGGFSVPGSGDTMSVLNPGGESPLLSNDPSRNFNGFPCYPRQPVGAAAIESLLAASPLSTLSLPFQFMDFNEGSGAALEGADPEECRVRALLQDLHRLQFHPNSLKPRDVVFGSSFVSGRGGELQYQVIEEGSFGKVFAGSLARRPEQKVAIKVPVEAMLKTDPAGVVERFTNEWKILAACDHPGIVGLVGGVVHGPFDVWLVTNLVENGHDLHSRKYSRDPEIWREISPQAALSMCRQLASIVAYLHTPKPAAGKPVIVHRDIKPENVIVNDEWQIQICDFGDAEASADGRVSRVSGATWFYAPPELLQSSPVERAAGTFVGNSDADCGAGHVFEEPVFSEKWDIWSMGCVFHEMFGFQNPFHTYVSPADPPESIYQKLKERAQQNALVPVIDSRIQGLAREIIAKCLNPDPKERPSADEVSRMWASADDLILQDVQLEMSDKSSHEQEVPKSVAAPQDAAGQREGQAAGRGANLVALPDAHNPASAPDLFGQPHLLAGASDQGLLPDRPLMEDDPAMRRGAQLQGTQLCLPYDNAFSTETRLPMTSCGTLPNDSNACSVARAPSAAPLSRDRTQIRLSSARKIVTAERCQHLGAYPTVPGGYSETNQQGLRYPVVQRNFGLEPAAPVGLDGHNQHMHAKRMDMQFVPQKGVAQEDTRMRMNAEPYLGSCAPDQCQASPAMKTTGGQRSVLGIGPEGAGVRNVGGDGFVSVPNLAVVSAASADFVC